MGINEYIKTFFNNLEIYEDIEKKTNYKENIYNSIIKFLDNRTEINAYAVYESFFNAYWIGIQEDINPFLELTKKMKNFEEYSGKLLESHRDHYIHTVFVFLLGLSIYSQNSKYRQIFSDYALDKSKYPDFYKTQYEEFFYRWGISSLFHDIAYPLEITIKQANDYISFISEYSDFSEGIKGIGIKLSTSYELFNLPVLEPRPKSKDKFYKKYNELKTRFLDNSISLLSYVLCKNFNIDLGKIEKNLKDYVENMNKKNIIDHGFFSAIIVLRWYYYLIKKTNWNPAYFYFPILDSSTSILLHNYYKHTLMEDPFNLNLMNANQHPIAYLLILCDELQEWNRKDYGRIEIKKNNPVNFDLFIDNKELKIKYQYSSENYDENFIDRKYWKITSVIDIDNIFNNGITIE